MDKNLVSFKLNNQKIIIKLNKSLLNCSIKGYFSFRRAFHILKNERDLKISKNDFI